MQQVKLDPKKSKFAKHLEAKEAEQALEKHVQEVRDQAGQRQQLIFNLGKQFLALLQDKTLSENKGPLTISLEKELLDKLITFAIEVNNDENEQADMGSISLIILVLKSFLSMHDRHNHLEFALVQAEKKIAELEKKIQATIEK